MTEDDSVKSPHHTSTPEHKENEMTQDDKNRNNNAETNSCSSEIDPFNNAVLMLSCQKAASESLDKWVDPALDRKAKGGASKGPRTAGEACTDSRLLLNLASYENHCRVQILIQKGEICLVDSHELQRLKEKFAAGEDMDPASYVSKEGWEQELERMGILADELRRVPLSTDQLRAILKGLPAVTRSSLSCDLGLMSGS